MKFITDRMAKNGPELQALCTGGLPYFVTARNPPSLHEAIPVFCYHVISSDAFERDLQFLQKNQYGTITADEVLDWINQKYVPHHPAVVLTFDDAPDNFYRVAYPLLCKYKQKAILFIAPGLHLPKAQEHFNQNRPCTWEELDEMHASGYVDIQSHTLEHRSLQSWPTPLPLAGISPSHIAGRRSLEAYDMQTDLTKARELIEKRYNKNIKHLAWPCYYTSTEAIALAEQAGYQAFWTGYLPHIPMLVHGHDPHKIVRLSGEFLQRLPGKDRKSLASILKARYKKAIQRIWS